MLKLIDSFDYYNPALIGILALLAVIGLAGFVLIRPRRPRAVCAIMLGVSVAYLGSAGMTWIAALVLGVNLHSAV